MSDSIVGKEYLPNVHIEKITYQPFANYQKAMNRGVVIFHSFFGLEKIRCIPPNIIMNGPLFKN